MLSPQTPMHWRTAFTDQCMRNSVQGSAVTEILTPPIFGTPV